MLLISTTFVAGAQNEFYQKYSNKDAVTKVYISKALFSLIGSGEGMNVKIGETGNTMDVGRIVKNLEGLYVLTTDDKKLAAEMDSDFKTLISNYKLELLMEVNDNNDEVKMYVVREGKFITNFFMHSRESEGELAVIFLGGRIPEEDLMSVMKSAM